MPERCCVFQPFDNGGPYDRRYSEVMEPAVREAGLEPYRVDRDPHATIPIDTLETEIKTSGACVADISTDNPNVWYELGYAMASDTPVIMICSANRSEPLPFDIRHRNVIHYSAEAPGDFTQLQRDITARLTAELAKRARVEEIISASPAGTGGLRPHEISALALIMANRDSPGKGVDLWTVKRNLEKAGFNALAANLGLAQLQRMGFATVCELHDPDTGEDYEALFLTDDGEGWLIENQERFDLGSKN